MSINQKQIEAVLQLPAPKRYSHFIKKVVGWKKVWALYNDGWALSETDDETLILPLWPEKEYADLCISGDWSAYEARSIDLEEVLDDMLPMLRERKILPGVFFTMEDGSVNATVDQLESDLITELSKYA
ncbi:DUF2750 domain-containing protein [Vibrio antiquarius]|uniref:DUF2750 domain-containing protein n=1 Tax=Vibrio antiquarius (strain Ex25) TaxID=150340 RepID=UPI0026592211|nr:DUF2750 domain-containing protein [Vibrio antiquarius]MCR9628583.1 DUF2750 domain-containing protein [Vibrio antiquarius]MCR9633735.1 DUF2750 domain-containing protein [Vibrio antiquarius]